MIWYSLYVRSFADTNGDGIGDLRGVIEKLEYLQALGIEGIWLLPIHPSPSYHKYDVVDYRGIDPEYGTMDDFDELLNKAHQIGIKIIIDLVVNHTSEQHPWFKEAIKSRDSYFRNWYVWKIVNAIPVDDLKNWYDPMDGPRDEFYYGLFWSGMPDLNFDHPPVRNEIREIATFWLNKGIDGFRLDAAMHIFPPGRETDNYLWWQEFRAHVESINPEAVLIGEITASCGNIAPYLKNGLHAAFNFELAEHILQVVITEHQDCLADWLKGIHNYYQEIDAHSFDAIFLSNHDQDRVASRLHHDSRKIKLAAAILLTLPGQPFLYYGEELGMGGMKPDEHIREPFPWDESNKDPLQTHWINSEYSNAQHTDDLMEQLQDPSSIFNHYCLLIAVRKSNSVLTKGEIGLVNCNETSVLMFTREYQGEKILILHNLLSTDVLLKNEDDPLIHFELLHETHPDCEADAHQFKLAPYASMILKAIPSI
ncbi:alpha-amylase family glycosyl hydrolase [soil metagenome]